MQCKSALHIRKGMTITTNFLVALAVANFRGAPESKIEAG